MTTKPESEIRDSTSSLLPPSVRILRHPLTWILLIALAVRLLNLTYHSLWFDEVMSTFWAGRPAGEIWRVGLALAQDKHPPLYYWLLHLWTALWGPGDAAVRSLGAMIGALAVLPAYGIGAVLGGRRAGALGALFLALNPFLIWYSQEARMFMPATTFVLVGLYGVLLVMANGGQRSEVGKTGPASPFHLPLSALLIVLGFSAALYSYLFSAFAVPVAAAWLLMRWWQGRQSPDNRRRFLWAVAALGLVILLFLPLAWSAWQVSGAESLPGRAFAGLGEAVTRLLPVYTIGRPGWPDALSTLVTGLLAALLLAGILLPSPSSGSGAGAGRTVRRGGLYLAVWLLLPLLIGGLLLVRDRTVFAEDRYLLFLAPALCLGWGRALAWLLRPNRPTVRWLAGVAGVALVAGILIAALPGVWSPENRREAWREAAAYVAQHAGPNDAVLIHADYVAPAFGRYFDGPQPVFFPITDPVTDPSALDPILEGLMGFDTVWLVQSHNQELDPGNLIAGWFAARFPLVTEQFPEGIALRGFAPGYRPPAAPVQGPPTDSPAFGPLRLLSCVPEPGPVSARDDIFHPPSGWVHVTTYWTAAEPATIDIFPSLQVVDASGQVWGRALERRNDTWHVWPTSRWLPGEVVRADADVNLNPITPPGRYRVVLEDASLGVQVICGEVMVE